jgi:hypothetical protein
MGFLFPSFRRETSIWRTSCSQLRLGRQLWDSVALVMFSDIARPLTITCEMSLGLASSSKKLLNYLSMIDKFRQGDVFLIGRRAKATTALASGDGPIFSTVAKLVEALKRSIPEGTQNAELKQEACALGVNRSAGRNTRGSEDPTDPSDFR